MAKPSKKKRRVDAPIEKANPSLSSSSEPTKPKKSRASAKKAGAAKPRRDVSSAAAMAATDVSPDRLVRLLTALRKARGGALGSARTHKLLASGVSKMAQKLVEEATETAIEAVQRRRATLIEESADLLFNLTVLWYAMKVAPADVWAEMDRREKLFGLAEKLPKPDEMT